MIQVKHIETNNNHRDIKNVLDRSDDLCWFSNGAKSPAISLKVESFVNLVNIEFQKGFHPALIEIKELCIEYKVGSKEGPCVKIEVNRHLDAMTIVLHDSYDPYGRICIYHINLQ
jgi:hypothetical protein